MNIVPICGIKSKAGEEKMSSFQRRTSVRVVKILNILLMTAVFGVMWYVFYADTIRVPFYNKGNGVVIGIFTVL